MCYKSTILTSFFFHRTCYQKREAQNPAGIWWVLQQSSIFTNKLQFHTHSLSHIHLNTLHSVFISQQFASLNCTHMHMHTRTYIHTHTNSHTHTHTYTHLTWITVYFQMIFSPHTIFHIIRSPSQEHCKGQPCHYDLIFARMESWAGNVAGTMWIQMAVKKTFDEVQMYWQGAK
jgi:hypothetical protein